MQNRHDGASRRARALLLALGVAGVAAAFASPAWSERLRGEGYRYADLAVTLTTQSTPVGATAPAAALLQNLGPEDAHNVVVVLRAFDGAALHDGSGVCTSIDSITLRCDVATLPVVDFRQFTFDVTAPFADVDQYTLAAYATGDEIDPVPGNELVAVTTPLAARHELAVTASDERPTILANGAARWRFYIANYGPSTVRSGDFGVDIFNGDGSPGDVSTTLIVGGGCWTRCDIAPGTTVEFTATSAPLSATNSLVFVHAYARSQDGYDPGEYPNDAYIGYVDLLFADGIE